MPLDKRGVRAKFGHEPTPGRFFALAAFVLALVLAACGGGSSQVSPGNLNSAGEVLAESRDALSSVNSYRLETVMVTKNQDDDRQMMTGSINLTWSAPDRLHAVIEGVEEGEEAQRYEYISTDGRIMARQSATGNFWVEYDKNPDPDDMEARGILAAVEGFSSTPNFLPDMDDAELVGITDIDGLSFYHIKGSSSVRTEPPDDLPADLAASYPRQQTDTSYDLYISLADLLPRRLVMVVELTWQNFPDDWPEIEPPRMESTVDYLDFNDPVSIVLPEAG